MSKKIHQITVALTKEGPFKFFSQDSRSVCESGYGDKAEAMRTIGEMMDRLKPVTSTLGHEK